MEYITRVILKSYEENVTKLFHFSKMLTCRKADNRQKDTVVTKDIDKRKKSAHNQLTFIQN